MKTFSLLLALREGDTDPLYGESTGGDRCVPLNIAKCQWREALMFSLMSTWTVEQTAELAMISDAMAFAWRHCKDSIGVQQKSGCFHSLKGCLSYHIQSYRHIRPGRWELTHWGLIKLAHILKNTLQYILWNEKYSIVLAKFNWCCSSKL